MSFGMSLPERYDRERDRDKASFEASATMFTGSQFRVSFRIWDKAHYIML